MSCSFRHINQGYFIKDNRPMNKPNRIFSSNSNFSEMIYDDILYDLISVILHLQSPLNHFVVQKFI